MRRQVITIQRGIVLIAWVCLHVHSHVLQLIVERGITKQKNIVRVKSTPNHVKGFEKGGIFSELVDIVAFVWSVEYGLVQSS